MLNSNSYRTIAPAAPFRRWLVSLIALASIGCSESSPENTMDASIAAVDAQVAEADADVESVDAGMEDVDAGDTPNPTEKCLLVEYSPADPSTWNHCEAEIVSCYANSTNAMEVDACFDVSSSECRRCFDDEYAYCVNANCLQEAREVECCVDQACPDPADEVCIEMAKQTTCSEQTQQWNDCASLQTDCHKVPEQCVQECQPETCQSDSCGTIQDGCGGDIDCGGCASETDSCGGGGIENQCGCTPNVCPASYCGTMEDGCGGVTDCGGCAGVDSCGGGGVENQCGCTPSTCSASSCGTIQNGCGGDIDCGGCASETDSCGGGGVENQCGCTPTTCEEEGASCGVIADQCGGEINCGECPLFFDFEAVDVSAEETSVAYEQSISVQATIRNTGVDPSPYATVHFMFSSDSWISTSDKMMCSRSIATLEPGQSVQVNGNCKVPALSSGQYYVGVIVDPTNLHKETSESNNNAVFVNTVEVSGPDYDLRYTLLWDNNGSAIKHPGDVVSYKLQVANPGSEDVGSFVAALHYSLDMNIGGFDPLICNQSLPGIPALTAMEYTFQCIVPNVATGNYFLGVRIDPNNEIPESDETNNIGSGALSELIVQE